MKKNLLFAVTTGIGAGLCVMGYKKIVKESYEFMLNDDCRRIDKLYSSTCDYKYFKMSIEPWVESEIARCKMHEADCAKRREYIEKLMAYAEERIQHKQWLGCEDDFKIENLEHPEYVLKQVEKLQNTREKCVIDPEPFKETIKDIKANAIVLEGHLNEFEKAALLKFTHKVVDDYLVCLHELNQIMEV